MKRFNISQGARKRTATSPCCFDDPSSINATHVVCRDGPDVLLEDRFAGWMCGVSNATYYVISDKSHATQNSGSVFESVACRLQYISFASRTLYAFEAALVVLYNICNPGVYLVHPNYGRVMSSLSEYPGKHFIRHTYRYVQEQTVVAVEVVFVLFHRSISSQSFQCPLPPAFLACIAVSSVLINTVSGLSIYFCISIIIALASLPCRTSRTLPCLHHLHHRADQYDASLWSYPLTVFYSWLFHTPACSSGCR